MQTYGFNQRIRLYYLGVLVLVVRFVFRRKSESFIKLLYVITFIMSSIQKHLILFFLAMITSIAYCQLDSTYRIKYLYEGWNSGSHYATHIMNFNKSDSSFNWKVKRTYEGCFLQSHSKEFETEGYFTITGKTLNLQFPKKDSLSKELSSTYHRLKIKNDKLKAYGSEKKKRELQSYYINILRSTTKPYNPDKDRGFLSKAYKTIRLPFLWVYLKGIHPLIKPKYFKPIEAL